MSPRGPRGFTLCLLLMVTAACLWWPCEGSTYETFKKNHQDHPKSSFANNNRYCQEMMQRRELMCRKRNIFVHATEQQLKDICTARWRTGQWNVVSKIRFPITICKRRWWRRSKCSYRGKSRVRRIRVTCSNGLPIRMIDYA